MSAMPSVAPCHRAIVAVDIENSTIRSNPAKGWLRQVMYGVFEDALRASGISEEYRDPLIDRGDGVLMLIHPVDQVPKVLLLDRLIPTLSSLLAAHAAQQPEHRFRLRAAVHAGEVHYDRNGAFGEDLDIAFRLLDAPQVKETLRWTTAPLVLVVSDSIYQSVVRQSYDGIDPGAFKPVVHVANQRYRGWVSVPAPPRDEPWSFHPVTGDPRIDMLLHRAGQDLDARATVRSLDPNAVVEQIFRNVRRDLPGTG